MALHALWDLLVVPKQFFASRRTEALHWHAFDAVMLTALISLVGFWLLMRLVAADAGPEFERALGQVMDWFVVLIPVFTLAFWGLVAGVVYLLVRNHAHPASYGRTFGVVGLAAVLEIPVLLVGIFDAYLLFEATSFADPQVAARQVEAADGRDPIGLVLRTVVTLWQGYIWRDGLRGVYDIETDRANLAAGAAVVLSLLFYVLG